MGGVNQTLDLDYRGEYRVSWFSTSPENRLISCHVGDSRIFPFSSQIPGIRCPQCSGFNSLQRYEYVY